MYPAVPTAVAVTEDGLHLLVYSDTHIDVFDVHSGDWVQVRDGGSTYVRTDLLSCHFSFRPQFTNKLLDQYYQLGTSTTLFLKLFYLFSDHKHP